MSKSKERAEARSLRLRGWAMKRIARQLDVSASSVHRWVADIVLTVDQRKAIDERVLRVRAETFRAWNKRKHLRACEKEEENRSLGRHAIGEISQRDVLLLGLGLYLGEGSKREVYTVSLSNMNKDLINLFLELLETLGISRKDVAANLYINPECDPEHHILWWCRHTGLLRGQFRKTGMKISPSSKGKTRRSNYHGILRVYVCGRDTAARLRGMLATALEGVNAPVV
jgi:hypothetical protein